jgi:hypothetical protein
MAERSGEMKMRALSCTTIASLFLLNACTTFGTNVEGDFSCTAPSGTCAPSSVIDDEALALISGAADVPVRYTPTASLASAAPSGAIWQGNKAVKIVFPSFVDEKGRFHEVAVVHAVVEKGEWIAASVTNQNRPVGISIPASSSLMPPVPSLSDSMPATREIIKQQVDAKLSPSKVVSNIDSLSVPGE